MADFHSVNVSIIVYCCSSCMNIIVVPQVYVYYCRNMYYIVVICIIVVIITYYPRVNAVITIHMKRITANLCSTRLYIFIQKQRSKYLEVWSFEFENHISSRLLNESIIAQGVFEVLCF